MQVKQIGKRLAEDGVPLTERERQTRSLAVLAKTMRELIAIEAAEVEARKLRRHQKLQTQSDDNSFPRDIDELRRELTQRINALIDARQAGAADEVLTAAPAADAAGQD